MALEDTAFLKAVNPRSPLTMAAAAYEQSMAQGGLSVLWQSRLFAGRAAPLCNFCRIENGILGMRAFLQGEAGVTGLDAFNIFDGVSPGTYNGGLALRSVMFSPVLAVCLP